MINGTSGDDAISVVDGAAAGSIEVQSPQFENITFTNKANVTIDGAAGDDTFHVSLTDASTGMTSLTLQGGDGDDRIEISATQINLPGVDLTLCAETITISSSTITADDISISAQAGYSGFNPFSDIAALIDIDDSVITATGSLTIAASGTQQNPTFDNGILELRSTTADITVTNTALSAGGDLSVSALSAVNLCVDGFLPSLLLDITVVAADTRASVIVNGTTTIQADGDVLISSDASLQVSALSKALGLGGTVTIAVTVVSSTSEALLQGSSTLSSDGGVSISAKNLANLESVADGFTTDSGIPVGAGASIAITVADISTKAGIFENAVVDKSNSISITAQTVGNLTTAAEASVGGASDAISDTLHVKNEDEEDCLSGALINEINAIIDMIGEQIGGLLEGEGDSGSAVQVAGAFTYVSVDSASEASITSAGLIVTAGGLTIVSESLTNASAMASGMTSGGSVGVGAGVAVMTATHTNKAYIGEGVRVQAQGLQISALSDDYRAADDPDIEEDNINDFTVEAYSGQGADTVGISGALALNIVLSDTAAYIGKNASVALAGGDVGITSTNHTNVKTEANGAPDDEDEEEVESFFALFNESIGGEEEEEGGEEEGPQVGVGASIAITIETVKTLSYIDDDAVVTGANNITISASSDNTTETSAVSGTAGGVAIAPELALAIFTSQTEGYIGSGSALAVGGDLLIDASHNSTTGTSSNGSTTGSAVGIGVAVSINVVTEKTRSTTRRTINATGNVTLRAQSSSRNTGRTEAGATGGEGEDEEEEEDEGGEDGDPDTGGIDEMLNGLLDAFVTVAESNGAEGQGAPKESPESAETSEGKLNVAAAVALNVVSSLTEAFIPAGVTVTAGGTLTLAVSGKTDAEAKADASATGNGGRHRRGGSAQYRHRTELRLYQHRCGRPGRRPCHSGIHDLHTCGG